VTQAQWDAVMGGVPDPSRHEGADLPVHDVTWRQAVAYCNARSRAEGLTPAYTITAAAVTWDRQADGWRLPTEAEWEYLARGGSTAALPSGPLTELNCRLDPNLDAVGWYCGNGPDAPQPVAGKQANGLGLHDVCGNVREWCWDWYAAHDGAPALDPEGPASGVRRVCRGGSWYGAAQDCRSAARGALPPDSTDDTVGLRPVRTDFAR
jgi:formylglycine-generating enzyme required for sulfatase activity